MSLASERTGVGIHRHNTTAGVHPYDEVEWEHRDARITNYRDGAVAFHIALPFNPTGMASAGGDTYVVRRGNSLWLIARQVYGDGSRYTAIYRANPGLIQDPDRIFPGQQFKVPKS